MEFGLYVHIPYCLQKCHYCDFATFSMDHEVTMPAYTQLLLSELRSRAHQVPYRSLSSVYFGGGTPSLLPAEDILTIRQEIEKLGFTLRPDAEITLEINPGTVNKQKLDLYLAAGVNRYSVGVQTFNDVFLKNCGREHNAETSRQTLHFLREHNLHFSADLLFGLPHQTLADLDADLDQLLAFSPEHVSLYNLTVPTKHPMNLHRADDEIQAKMFGVIDARLKDAGVFRYEVSNFAKPGKESRHNKVYWNDQPYWGIGVSAHSYFPDAGAWGTRFFNPIPHREYARQALQTFQDEPFYNTFSPSQKEPLQAHEALTDFCHTHLRMLRGLSVSALHKKFGDELTRLVVLRLRELVKSGLLAENNGVFSLSTKGLCLTNQVFLHLTFSYDETMICL